MTASDSVETAKPGIAPPARRGAGARRSRAGPPFPCLHACAGCSASTTSSSRRASICRGRSSATSPAPPRPTGRSTTTAPPSPSTASCRSVLVDVSRRSQHTSLFGHTYASPFGIAPMGISALSAYRGDLVQARAAAAANIPLIMSGSSLIPLEDVARARRDDVVPGLPSRTRSSRRSRHSPRSGSPSRTRSASRCWCTHRPGSSGTIPLRSVRRCSTPSRWASTHRSRWCTTPSGTASRCASRRCCAVGRARRSSRVTARPSARACDAPQPAVRLGLASVRSIGDELAERDRRAP